MKIIFLDFDGVMDTAYYGIILHKNDMPEHDKYGVVFDPDCIQNLKYIINQTGANIVVTSTWKVFMSYQDILKMWEDRKLPGFVTDVTPTPVGNHKKGDEIDLWLKECGEECGYVIIDDLDAHCFNEYQLSRLLTVNPFNGLDKETAIKAVRILNI
ncbi:MAG: hypothetical protein K5893_03620 [Prevotella sp.]|nr:hypothetical protein [Prevotella sp.]